MNNKLVFQSCVAANVAKINNILKSTDDGRKVEIQELFNSHMNQISQFCVERFYKN